MKTKTLVRAHYPEGSRPRPLSSFEMAKLPPARDRFKLAVVTEDDFQNDIIVWSTMNQIIGKRIDVIVYVRTSGEAAARWGYWHWIPVTVFGEAEEDEFVKGADRLLIIGSKSDKLLAYYKDLAAYYGTKVSWASPKEE